MFSRIEPGQPRSFERCPVDDRACSRTVAVNTIRPGAKHGDVLAGNLPGAVKGKVLVAAAGAALAADLDCDLAAGNDACARNLSLQAADAVEEIIGSLRVIPIVAGVIDLHGEAALRRGGSSRPLCRRVREHGPPERTDKRPV